MLFEISVELLTDGGEILLLHNADLEESFNYFQLSLHSSVSPIASLNREKKKEKGFQTSTKSSSRKAKGEACFKGKSQNTRN